MSTIKKIKELFTCDLAIDLGTSRMIIVDKKRGIVVDEPSVVVVHENWGKPTVIAVGQEAYDMIGKVPRNHKVIRPIKKGVISNFDVAEVMIYNFIELALKDHPNKLIKPNPNVVVTVPVSATQIEERSLKSLILRAGAKNVETIEQPLAAAIGSEVDTDNSSGKLFLNMGAGITEIALISMNDIVLHFESSVSGHSLTTKIIDYFRYNYKVGLSYNDAERIKKELVDLNYKKVDDKEEESITITVKDYSVNIPVDFKITKLEACKSIMNEVSDLVKDLVNSLENIPIELLQDVKENGIYLSGGASEIKNLDLIINNIISLPVTRVENSKYVAVNGCLEQLL